MHIFEMANILTDISAFPNVCIKLKARRIFGNNILQSTQFGFTHFLLVVDAELDLIFSLVSRLPP